MTGTQADRAVLPGAGSAALGATVLWLALLLFSAGAQAQQNRQLQWRAGQGALYGGVSVMPISIKGLRDVDASDWENYGLLSEDPESQEGRVRVPLSAGNNSLPLMTGLKLGYQFMLTRRFALLGEISGHVGADSEMTAGTATIGADLIVAMGKRWRLAIEPRVGALFGAMNFGSVQLIEGYTAPVITPEGTFEVGDRLEAELGGLVVVAGAAYELQLTRRFGLRADLGFQYGFATDLSINAGPVLFEGATPSIVVTDGSSRRANIDPELTSLGVAASVGLVFRLEPWVVIVH